MRTLISTFLVHEPRRQFFLQESPCSCSISIACADQKNLVRGGPIFLCFYSFWRREIQSGPPSTRQRNAISMAFPWRADGRLTLNAGWVALWFSRGGGYGPQPQFPHLICACFVFMRFNFIIFISADTTDECSSNPCGNTGTCVDLGNTYECQCPSGYTGDQCGNYCLWPQWGALSFVLYT